MKRLLNTEDILVSIISAIGFGIGYVIPTTWDKPKIFCIIVSIIVGLGLGFVGEKLIKKLWARKSATNRDLMAIGIIVFFLISTYFTQKVYDHSLFEDLTYGLVLGTVGMSVSVFIVLIILQTIRAYLIKLRYKDGSKGHIVSKAELKYIEKIKGDNKEIRGNYDNFLAVKTENGIFVGKKKGKLQEFLGIPYAKPPVGNLRWKAPEKPDPSDRVWEAHYFGKSAIQPDNDMFSLNVHTQSEDCLTLNVWRAVPKKNSTALKPVLVYVHGGDLTFGGSAEPLYYGGNFVKKMPDVIVVSFNYRLGIFGFLDIDGIPDAEEYGDACNIGIMDQIMALNWVHDNIHAFGGDPDNIMLAGDIMGAYCIKVLSVLKESNTLFKKALLISCSTVDPEGLSKIPKVKFKDLMKEVGARTMAEMLSIPSDVLKRFISDNADKYWYLPLIGKGIIGKDVEQAIRDGDSGDIRFIYGIPADEISAMLSIGNKEDMDEWVNYIYDDMIKMYEGTPNATMLEKIFEKSKRHESNDFEAKIKSLEFLLYKYDALKNCMDLSALGKTVRCFYWNVSSPVKEYGGNSISAVAALLGNKNSAENLGYIIDNTIEEVFKRLIYNELVKDNPSLEQDEVKGVDKIKWQIFYDDEPTTLNITDNNMEMDDVLFVRYINVIKSWNLKSNIKGGN